jgi:hypothetical protein
VRDRRLADHEQRQREVAAREVVPLRAQLADGQPGRDRAEAALQADAVILDENSFGSLPIVHLDFI